MVSIKGSFTCNLDNINEYLTNENPCLFITQGFVCNTIDNKACLLTRGGSDTSASIFASKLNAKKMEIWTDVNGIYSGDPKTISNPKLIKYITYNLCQELAAMGAKVLHPYSIKPCQEKNIPILIRNTLDYNSDYTVIGSLSNLPIDENNKLEDSYIITNQNNITVFEIKSMDMWNQYGFLYHIFGLFSKCHIDVNIVITSQFSVSVTTNADSNKIYRVASLLEEKYVLTIYRNCTNVSIVNKDMRVNPYAKQINDIIEKINRHNIYIIHESSNHNSISYIMKHDIANEFSQLLHNTIINKNNIEEIVSKKIKLIENPIPENNFNEEIWWIRQKEEIFDIFNKTRKSSYYVYNKEIVKEKCDNLLKRMRNIDKFYYAMKANSNKEILKTIIDMGYGIECVSLDEIKFIRNNFGEIDIIFTPNYCNVFEYKKAFELNCTVIVDNIEVLIKSNEIFENKNIGIRFDCDLGDGHHEKVITEGDNCKFGLPINQIQQLILIAEKYKINIIGLHSHKGSGILDYNSWKKTGEKLIKLLEYFPNIEWIDLGGGLGVKTNKKELDLDKVNNTLLSLKNLIPLYSKNKINLFMEPGRFLVADSGILVSKVTQIRRKNNNYFIGISTGMNSLIRPTLYDAYHTIVNLSKIDKINYKLYHIVGPICETGDILGKNRWLPKTDIGDIILIDQSGAYGKVMSSNYNMREPAIEYVL